MIYDMAWGCWEIGIRKACGVMDGKNLNPKPLVSGSVEALLRPIAD